MQPFKKYIRLYKYLRNWSASWQQPNKVFKFLPSHSLDITSYAIKLPEKKTNFIEILINLEIWKSSQQLAIETVHTINSWA